MSEVVHDVGHGVFRSGQLEDLVTFFEVNGYATLRGVFDEQALAEAEDELAASQRLLVAGELDARHGTVILDEPDATIDGRPFAHYVCFATAASARADGLVRHPSVVDIADRVLGPERLAPRLRTVRRGLPGCPARSGLGLFTHRMAHRPPVRSPSGHLARCRVHHPLRPDLSGERIPACAPGQSPRRRRPACRPASSGSPARSRSYQERGDVLFHHADLWHGAARGTADGPAAVRRHLRGSWHGGARLEPGHGTEDFVKNALR